VRGVVGASTRSKKTHAKARAMSKPKVATRRAVRQQRKKRIRVYLLALLRCFACCAAGALAVGVFAVVKEFLIHHELFEVKEIEVAGIQFVPEDEVRRVAGIQAGDNIFAVDSAVARSKLISLPRVKRAIVRKKYPDKMSILVEEREPFAVMLRGRLYDLDSEGVVLCLHELGSSLAGPVITGAVPRNLSFGKNLGDENVDSALEVLRKVRREEPSLLRMISEVHCERDGDISLILEEGGLRVDLHDGDWDRKVPWILPVLEAERKRGTIHRGETSSD